MVGGGDGQGGFANAAYTRGGEGDMIAGGEAGDEVVEQGITADESVTGKIGDAEEEFWLFCVCDEVVFIADVIDVCITSDIELISTNALVFLVKRDVLRCVPIVLVHVSISLLCVHLSSDSNRIA